MFSFTNKKFMGVWSSEVKCIKWMEKLEVIQKTLQWKYYTIIDFHEVDIRIYLPAKMIIDRGP